MSGRWIIGKSEMGLLIFLISSNNLFKQKIGTKMVDNALNKNRLYRIRNFCLGSLLHVIQNLNFSFQKIHGQHSDFIPTIRFI